MKLENEEIKKYLQILSKEFPAFLIEYTIKQNPKV